MSLSLLAWRRRVHDIYAEVRATADPRAAHDQWCAARDDLLTTHPDSPMPVDARGRIAGLPVAAYDPAYRFELELDPDVAPHRLEVTTATDGIVPFERIGVLHVPEIGDLDVWWLDSYGGGIFVPVKDRLAGRDTYGAGRYLLDTVKGADLGGDIDLASAGDRRRARGSLVVDLNFAYNPSCAYDPAWACPLAPPGNTVRVELPVGELHPVERVSPRAPRPS